MDESIIDALTVKFFRDTPGPLYAGPEPPTTWGAFIGPDYIGGCGGFGPSPLAALRDLCDVIAKDEGHRTDNGAILLR